MTDDKTESWACPNCGSTDLRVDVIVTARLVQSADNFETEVEGDHYFDGDSLMLCSECEHEGPSAGFLKEEGETA